MRPLKLSMLGVRGVVGEALTPELIAGFAQAFGTYVGGGTILVSRDPRASGEMASSAVFSGLLSVGCEVTDLGICPTPAAQMLTRDSDASGAIAVSAGHNEEEWNALKLITSEGLFFNAYQGEELLDVYHQGSFDWVDWRGIRPMKSRGDAAERQVDAVAKLTDAEAIRARGFRVVADCCNGACSLTTPRLLERLGAQAIMINDRPEPPFPRNPEPSPRTLGQASALVKATSADLGLAHDADGERLGLVTEKGEALSEEFTLCLLADAWLSHEPGPIVCNVSTSLMMDAIAARYRVPLYRARVGQAYVVEGIQTHSAVLGGEGSGGVIFPRHLLAHDALASAAYLLHFMAKDGGTLSERVERLPKYHSVKEEVEYSSEGAYRSLFRYREAMEEESSDAELDLTEGIRQVWRKADGTPRAALHVRASMTEPLIRIISEAESEEEAGSLAEEALARLRFL